MVSKVSYYSIGCHAGICLMDKEGRTRSRTCIVMKTMSPSVMGEVQYNQSAIKGLSGTQGSGPC